MTFAYPQVNWKYQYYLQNNAHHLIQVIKSMKALAKTPRKSKSDDEKISVVEVHVGNVVVKDKSTSLDEDVFTFRLGIDRSISLDLFRVIILNEIIKTSLPLAEIIGERSKMYHRPKQIIRNVEAKNEIKSTELNLFS